MSTSKNVVSLIEKTGADTITLHSTRLAAMARWADRKFKEGLARFDAAARIKNFGGHVHVFAGQFDRTARIMVEEYRIGGRSDDQDVPALAIRVSREEPAFEWRFLRSDYSRVAQTDRVVIGVFDGTRLAFEFELAPRPSGMSAARHFDGFLTQLESHGGDPTF